MKSWPGGWLICCARRLKKEGRVKSYQNSKTLNIKYIDIKSDDELNKAKSITEAARYIVDNLLPNDSTAKNFYFVTFPKQSTNLMIAQKADWDKGYAAFILFGYGIEPITYNTKRNGAWNN